jgi:hypothetical protein
MFYMKLSTDEEWATDSERIQRKIFYSVCSYRLVQAKLNYSVL